METIAKVGGSSVSQPALVRGHMEREGPDVIVVSAPGCDPDRGETLKVTQMLLEFGAPGREAHDIQRRFGDIALDMGSQTLHEPVVENIPADIATWLSRGWPLAGLGEHWTSQMYAGYLGRQWVDARRFVRFNTGGQLDLLASVEAAQTQFTEAGRYVTGGFLGADSCGAVRLLPRGGSDITPALIARALGASEYHNWSDVDGFMTRDPRQYQDSELIAAMSFRQAIDMAESGCQLLHPEACRILGGTAVRVVMRNTFGEPGNRGTTLWCDEIAEAA